MSDKTFQKIIGNNNTQIGSIENVESVSITYTCSGCVGVIAQIAQASITLRAKPISKLPKPFHKLVGRNKEVEIALNTLPTTEPVEFYGVAGIGKSVLLQYLANHPHISSSFPEVIIYYDVAYKETPLDILQRILQSFYEVEKGYVASEIQVANFLKNKKPLIILDSSGLSKEDKEILINTLPDSSFLFSSHERHFWGNGRSKELSGLDLNASLELVKQTLERELMPLELDDAKKLCNILEGNPRKIFQEVELVRDGKYTFALLAKQSESNKFNRSGLIISVLSQPHRLVLSFLAAIGINVSIGADAVAHIAELSESSAILTDLASQGLVKVVNDRFQIVSDLVNEMQSSIDVSTWITKATQFFTSWTKQHQDLPEIVLQESDVILRVMELSISSGNALEVVELGKVVESAYAISGQWGRWEIVLKWVQEASQIIGDEAIKAFALHQRGTRALCLNQMESAQKYLTQALVIRESIGDQASIGVTKHNLNLILKTPSGSPKKSSNNNSSLLWKSSIPIFLLVMISFGLLRQTNTTPTTNPELLKQSIESLWQGVKSLSDTQLLNLISIFQESFGQGMKSFGGSLVNLLPKLKSIELSSQTVKAGESVKVRVVLDNPVTPETSKIELVSSNFRVKEASGNINNNIEVGKNYGEFEFSIPQDLQDFPEITISAIYNGERKNVTLKVIKQEPEAISIEDLRFQENSIKQCMNKDNITTNLEVLLNKSIQSGEREIALASSNPNIIFSKKVPITDEDTNPKIIPVTITTPKQQTLGQQVVNISAALIPQSQNINSLSQKKTASLTIEYIKPPVLKNIKLEKKVITVDFDNTIKGTSIYSNSFVIGTVEVDSFMTNKGILEISSNQKDRISKPEITSNGKIFKFKFSLQKLKGDSPSKSIPITITAIYSDSSITNTCAPAPISETITLDFPI
ncbi:ATP-binding protein [Pseudanabaena sp. ABRG5-3]|uniref:ATP-binding protein n=1 Tax=Pseudanabaena sp. ABRG5-3 TaxID=685565 RepID=UPI000DC71943|nr:ATP-binding protein [Pseudanabaena sp. ABRG5-3]BBC22289.1 AAA ATPase [Pseudanabaena sp. ABRG5-3]